MKDQQEHLNALEGEREMPNVNESRGNSAKRGIFIITIVIIVLLATAVGVMKYRAFVASKEETAQNKEKRLKSTVPTRTFTEPPHKKTFEEVQKEAPIPVQPATPAQPAAEVIEKPTADKSLSGLMIAVGKTTGSPSVEDKRTQTGEGEGPLSGLLSSTKTKMRSASLIGDRNYIIAKGRFINCALNTRLDSTVPGMTSCVVTRNQYSDNGKVLLVERGSEMSGEYKSNMKQGMARIFVLWTRIKTPNGVVVSLDSPGADPLGGSGLPGYVDTHFWDRFGGALLLSMVDDVAAYATNKADDSEEEISFDNTSDATQEMAAEALKNTINIPPTLYINQGEEIGIYVARDLDFSEVYHVGPSETK